MTAPYLFRDFSNNQKVCNGAAEKANGMYAIAAKVSEGDTFVDVNAAANYHQAAVNGLPFMGYHFLDATDGAGQANHFVQCLTKASIPIAKVSICLDRENGLSPVADAFIATIRQLSPNHPHFVGYEAAWVTSEYGASGGMASLPLWWSNYFGPTGVTPQAIMPQITPNYFVPFGGHTAAMLVARQFTDGSVIGGQSADCSVVWSDAELDRLFFTGTAPPVTHTVAPTVPVAHPAVVLVVDGVMGALTVQALQRAIGASPVDGIYGPETKKKLQASLGVTQDGIIGPITVKALQRKVGAAQDGIWGKQTTMALQRTLNAGKF